MKTLRLVVSLLVLQLVSAFGQFPSPTVNDDGTLRAPSTFFSANAALIREALNFSNLQSGDLLVVSNNALVRIPHPDLPGYTLVTDVSPKRWLLTLLPSSGSGGSNGLTSVEVNGVAGVSNLINGSQVIVTKVNGTAQFSLAETYALADADLADLADGSLTGSKVGSGIDADNITAGTVLAARIDAAVARLAGPIFVSDPKAPTPLAGDNDTSIATTAFVTAAVAAVGGGGGGLSSIQANGISGVSNLVDNAKIALVKTGGDVQFSLVESYALADPDLADLADGSLDGAKVGSGINGGNITAGTVAAARIDAALPRLANTQTFSGTSNTFLGDIHVLGSLNSPTQSVDVLNVGALRLAGAPSTLLLFGDSVTYGSSASTAAARWGNLVAAANGWASTNLAYGSATIPDINWQMYPGFTLTNGYDGAIPISPSAITTNSQSALLVGYNDLRDFGSDSARRSSFERGLLAALTYAGIPSSERRVAQAGNVSGTWTNISWWGGAIARESLTVSSTLTWSNLVGNTLYVCYTDAAATTNGGTFTVTVDGSLYATITATNAYGNRTWRNGSDSSIPHTAGPYGNGKIDVCPAVLRIPALGVRPHTVTITVTATNTGPVRVMWAASSGGAASRSAQEGPFVYVGGAIRQAVWTGAGTDAAAALYSSSIQSVVSDLSSDGIKVAYARAAETYNPITGVSGDGVHPADAGLVSIAQAFIAATGRNLTGFRGTAADAISGSSIAVGDAAPTGSVRLPTAGSVEWKHPTSRGTGASIAQASTADGLNITWSNSNDQADRSLAFVGHGNAPLVDFTLTGSAGSSYPLFRINATSGLTAASGTQIAQQSLFTVNQSGTAGFVGYDIDVTATAVGSGTRELIRARVNGTNILSITDRGSATIVAPSTATAARWIWQGDLSTDAQVSILAGYDTDRRLEIAGNSITVTDSSLVAQNLALGNSSAADVIVSSTSGRGVRLGSSSGPLITFGAGSPEGAVTAPVSSAYHRTDGGAGTSIYYKQTGSGNTGWVAFSARKSPLTTSIAYAATVTPDVDTSDIINVGTLTGNVTVAAPTGTPVDGQTLQFRFEQNAGGGWTTTFNGIYVQGTSASFSSIPVAANARWNMTFQYHSSVSQWRLMAILVGF